MERFKCGKATQPTWTGKERARLADSTLLAALDMERVEHNAGDRRRRVGQSIVDNEALAQLDLYGSMVKVSRHAMSPSDDVMRILLNTQRSLKHPDV